MAVWCLDMQVIKYALFRLNSIIYNAVGAPYAETRAALAESMSISVGYYQIDHGKISMD